MPQGGGPEPVLPARFHWDVFYEGIKARGEIYAERGDIYAAHASASALREIEQAVMVAYFTHRKIKLLSTPQSTPAALESLKTMRAAARSSSGGRTADPRRYEAVERSLKGIYQFTYARFTELGRRRDEFLSVSLPRAAPVPHPEALGRWLRTQAGAAHGTEPEHSYFIRLAQEVPRGRDPWTVSRELVKNLPRPGNEEQAERVRALHVRLVRAIARGLSERPSESGSPEPPGDFQWLTAQNAIRTRYWTDTMGGDFYAAAAGASALREIEQTVMETYYTYRLQRSLKLPSSVPDTLRKVRTMLGGATRSGDQSRAGSIRRSLDAIDRLTHACNTELKRRADEFRSASLPHAAPVPDREALGRWLRTQAGAAHDTDIEHPYFTQLAQEVSRGRDPWTVSRELMASLPGPGDTGHAKRLRAAHVRLVRAIAGSLPQQAAVPPPDVPQASRESRASTSMRDEMVERLSSRSPLSDRQVQAIVSGVARAIASGTLGTSTSRPEAWARGLVERVQASISRPIGNLTESERDRESSELTRLVELLDSLDSAGCL